MAVSGLRFASRDMPLWVFADDDSETECSRHTLLRYPVFHFPTPDMSSVPAIFVHIPKTGGSTLRDIVRRQYGGIDHVLGLRAFTQEDLRMRLMEELEAWNASSAESTNELRAVSGHFIFGAHRYLPDTFQYITVLREPIDRVISDFYYVRRTPTHDLYDPVVTKNYTLEDYVTSGVTIYARNLQTRMLAGKGRDVSIDESSEQMLDQAIRNAKNYFSVIGLTDQFDESLILMQRRLGWTLPLYMTRNRTKKRPKRNEVTASTRAVIQRYNALDVALYEYALQRLGEQLDREDPDAFQRDLQRLQLLNKAYAPAVRMYIRFRRTCNRIVGREII